MMRLLLPILWMALIFVLSGRESITVAPTWTVNFLIFKTLHVIEYGILYVLWYRAVRDRRAAWVATMAYAVFDELHQTFVPTREGRLRDVIIDGIGVGLAWYAITQLLPKAPKRLRTLARGLRIY